MTLVSLHHVSVAYDGCEALRDVDLQIDDRDFSESSAPTEAARQPS